MLERLLKLKPFCERHSSNYPDLKLTEFEWAEIVDLTEALKPAKVLTKQLQAEQLVLGDFFGDWLNCKLKTTKINTDFAKNLVIAMTEREKRLLSDDVFISAIFLDPR